MTALAPLPAAPGSPVATTHRARRVGIDTGHTAMVYLHRGSEIVRSVLSKHRRGDREVELRLPDLGPPGAREPVLVDDIVSTGVTLLRGAGFAPPRCVAVHGVLAGDAEAELLRAGARSLVTCNTLAHPTNRIDVLPAVVDGVRRLIAADTEPALAPAR